MRKCGECSLCCKLIEVRELSKPAGANCPHRAEIGCSLYGTEKMLDCCLLYSCMWLLLDRIPDELRPDRCRVIFEKIDDRTFIGISDPAFPGAWRMGIAADFIRLLMKQGASAVIAEGTTKNVLPVAGRSEQSIFDAIGDRIRKDEEKWRLRLTQQT